MTKILSYIFLLGLVSNLSYSETTKLKAKIISNEKRLTIKISKYSSQDEDVVTEKSDEIFYTVKSGDTLSKIAKHYKKDTQKIAKDNGIKKSDFLLVGQTLIIK